MAFGIFGLASLPRLLPGHAGAAAVFSAGVGAAWLYLALHYGASLWRGQAAHHTRGLLARFAVGTWVAGSGVTGELLLQTWPNAGKPVALVLLLLALAGWVWLLWLAAAALPRLFAQARPGPGSTPIVLLGTVSTQALVLLADALLTVPQRLLAAVIGFGLLLYLTGIGLIAWRYWQKRDAALVRHSSNSQCIVHGALSISGLAIVTTGVAPAAAGTVIAAAALVAFACVETIEVLRLASRVSQYGWRRGVFTYRVSQWVRNFTFGMLYAFMHALHADAAAQPLLAGLHLAGLVGGIAAHGEYVVLGLLLVESGLWLARQAERHGLPVTPGVRE